MKNIYKFILIKKNELETYIEIWGKKLKIVPKKNLIVNQYPMKNI